MTIEEIWNKCLLIIREKVEESAFELWFKTIRLTSIKEGVATIEIPNRFFKEWIED